MEMCTTLRRQRVSADAHPVNMHALGVNTASDRVCTVVIKKCLAPVHACQSSVKLYSCE